jgi:hypothetical protein
MDKSTHNVRMEHWKAIVQQCQARPERQTASSWLAENGVNDKQYYYWLRQIRREAYEEMKTRSLPADSNTGNPDSREVTFAEIPVSRNATCQPMADLSGFHVDAVVRIGAATIAVSNTASAELLGRILDAVNHAC